MAWSRSATSLSHTPSSPPSTELEELVKEAARQGEIHLSFDLKPEYQDTPRKWQDRLETAFTSIIPRGR